MPTSKSPYRYILVLLCDISNFLVATPMKKATAEEVCSILFDHFIAYYAAPQRIICDQDPAFMSSLCQWVFQILWNTASNSEPNQPQIPPSRTWH